MNQEQTTVVVQRQLDALDREEPAESAIRALLEPSIRRLQQLCGVLLHRSYPRLMRPPMNLQTDEMLGAVVERLMKALRSARPDTVRQYFALATRHMRWELNDMARRLDSQPANVAIEADLQPATASSGSQLSPDSRRMLAAIENLPEEEREAFDLVRVQGLSQAESAQVLGVSLMTVNRRLNRALVFLTRELADLRPETPPCPTTL